MFKNIKKIIDSKNNTLINLFILNTLIYIFMFSIFSYAIIYYATTFDETIKMLVGIWFFFEVYKVLNQLITYKIK